MSIFGPKDKDVHLLTAYYQLEFDPENPVGSELDRWLLLRQFGYNMPSQKPGINAGPMCENWSEYQIAVNPKSTEIHLAELKDVAQMQTMARTLMRAMADKDLSFYGTGIVQEALGELPRGSESYWYSSFRELNKRATDIRPILTFTNTRDPAAEDKPLAYQWIGGGGPFTTAIIISLVLELPRGYQAFRWCPICESVFIADGRHDQKYCSHRCKNRAGVKKFREKAVM